MSQKNKNKQTNSKIQVESRHLTLLTSTELYLVTPGQMLVRFTPHSDFQVLFFVFLKRTEEQILS